MSRDPVLRVFDKLVIETNGCWIFTGGKTSNGYGLTSVGGKTRLAHRITYEYFRGPIPHGLVIDHLCRNRACCNPWCMRVCTNRENLLAVGSMSQTKSKLEQTHCHRGHAFTAENTRIKRDGTRNCKVCQSIHMESFRERHKAKSPVSLVTRG